MTIASSSREVKELIQNHHVYGAEAVINAVVFGSIGEAYIDKEVLKRMIDKAYERLNCEV